MPRYAVLLDLDDAELRPIALVTEHDDAVRVHFAIECGLKSEYSDPYVVREPDGQSVRYEPGTPEYFTSVINTLSRAFAVTELEPVDALDPQTIVDLYVDRVVLPRAPRQTIYSNVPLVVSSRAGVAAVGGAYAHAVAYDIDEQYEPVRADDALLARAA